MVKGQGMREGGGGGEWFVNILVREWYRWYLKLGRDVDSGTIEHSSPDHPVPLQVVSP